MTPDGLLSALRHFDVQVHEHAGWRTRNHGPLSPARILAVHDSVTGHMTDDQAAEFCAAGRSDLAGPLYEVMVGQDGAAHLIANGVSWNAGKTNQSRFEQAAAGLMPLGAELGRPAADDYLSANQHAHAVAFTTYGSGPYSGAQMETGARICAAYIRAESWEPFGATSMIGHGELSSRKIDPQLSMGALRTRVHQLEMGSAELWHVVAPGETLWAISRRYGTTVDTLKRINHLTTDLLSLGQRLKVG